MILNSPTISGSLTVTGNIIASGSITLSGSVASASYAATASFVALAQSASNAVSSATASFANAFTVASTLTAQTLVVSTINVTQSFSSGSNIFGNALTNTQVFSGSISMNPGGLFVSGSGLVGIGITDPSVTFNVGNSAHGVGIAYRGSSILPSIAGLFTSDGTGGGQTGYGSLLIKARTDYGGFYSLNFFTATSNNTPVERMSITSAGNVGIGRTDPTRLLDVSALGTVYIRASDRTNSVNVDIYAASSGGGIGTQSNHDFILQTNNTQRINITNGGNVGIGANPSSYGGYLNMTLQSTGASGVNLDFKTSAGTREGVLLLASGTEFSLIAATAIPLTFRTTDVERMRIGATSTQFDLMVGCTTAGQGATNRGSITINGNASSILTFTVANANKGYVYHGGTQMYIENSISGGAINVNSGGSGGVILNSGATSWVSASDIRLKNINSNIENAIDKLLTLRAINFSWKSDSTNKEVLGLIAQEVETVFPQVVEANKLPSKPDLEQTDETEYLGVRYTELIPVLVKAIQELKTQNDALQSRIETLESK